MQGLNKMVDEDATKEHEDNTRQSSTSAIKGVIYTIILLAVTLAVYMCYKNRQKDLEFDIVNTMEEIDIDIVEKKLHPWKERESSLGFKVNNIEGGTLNLFRNRPYK